MDSKSAYQLTGEVAPFIQKKTKNSKEVAESGGGRKPWDQLPNETLVAYNAFLLYLDFGMYERSQSKVAKVLYGNEDSTSQIAKWSTKFDWINRSEAWDRFCVESRQEKMETAVNEAEDIMLAHLPQVAYRISKVATGEQNIGRAQMRAMTDFLDRVGPSKKRREAPTQIHNNLTVNAPQLPQEVEEDTSNIPEAEIIEEHADDLIPKDLQDKRGKH